VRWAARGAGSLHGKEKHMPVILWILGVPLSLILILWLLGVFS
jgi:hypothetical protein